MRWIVVLTLAGLVVACGSSGGGGAAPGGVGAPTVAPTAAPTSAPASPGQTRETADPDYGY